MTEPTNPLPLVDRAFRTNAPPSAAQGADAPFLALSEVIGATLDLAQTLKATATALRSVTGADRVAVYVHDAGRDVLRQVTSSVDRIGDDEVISLPGRAIEKIPLWHSVRSARGGVLDIADTVDLGAMSEERAQQVGMRALLGLVLQHPSRAAEGPLAIAYCVWDQPQPAFSAALVRSARSIAAQAAVAVANAQNHAQADVLAKRLSSLASWGSRLAAAETAQQAAGLAAQAAATLTQAPLVAHWSPERMVWHPAPPVGADAVGDELRALFRRGDRWVSLPREAAPPAVRAVLEACSLGHVVVAAAGNREGLIMAAREGRPSEVEEKVLLLLADLAGAALRSADAYARAARMATTDALTGVGNRHGFEVRIAEAVALSNRTGRPTSLCLIDVDNFRDFNEQGGHQRGDDALRLVAETLRGEIRASDSAFRVGGDEFALVLPETSASDAASLLNRVLTYLRIHPLLPLTITVGVAQAPEQGRDPIELFRIADAALYAGKRAGRAQVSVAPHPASEAAPAA